MSSSLGQTSTPTLDFKSILDAALSHALSEYKKTTGKQLLDHPLATQIKQCDSVDAILAVLRGQAEAFQQFRDGDHRLMKWISPVVDILYTFSATLGGVAGTAFPPAGAIFTGIGVLLAVARDARASHDALIELFGRIESFFKRLGVYSQTSLSVEMVEVFVKIVAEVLAILSIATKEMKRTRGKIFSRKLLGRTDIEDALKRLDSLIQEEVRMAIAQTMRATIEHRDDAKKASMAIANNIDEMKWNQIEQDVRKWFSPPDPSTNHNTVCEVYHKESPTWLFGAGAFKNWMSNGSLLWIHGNPGSGKSVVCSAIIQHIMTLRDAGKAILAYFYFDFRDEEKQNVRNLVTSLMVQLSAYSKPCCDIIYRLYSIHGKGTQQPSNVILIDRLKEMIFVAAQHPIFVIMDALDECPESGMPTPREAVLNLVKDLVHLQLPNLHIGVTSRQEVDIQTKLKPLTVNAISLHDGTRQKTVIADYVSSVVSLDVHMREWRDEDKKLVVKELSERADGMFQWVFCQLEALRHAVQPDVPGILKALPRTLDETYERMLKNVNEKNRKHARRLLHCLAVAVRPLRVEELAEVLTFDFDTAQGGIPRFHADRRPKDQEEAVLSICSSLVSIVDSRGSRVVQFSHLSVKEFLTSGHFASSTGHLTLYHILPGIAHTIFAQVCLGLLIHLDDRNDKKCVKGSPLAGYAARHWVAHAQFEDVASRVEDGMKSLFDPDKIHFAAWIGLYDIDAESGGKSPSEIPSPLYYSALYGFRGLTRHIVTRHPWQVNAIGGFYGFPLVAALFRNNLPVAEFLLEHGGNVDVRDTRKQSPLHKTIDCRDIVAVDAVRFLLEHGADVNARRDDLWTPLHLAVNIGELSVAQMLLEHQADANSRNDDGQAPLHLLSKRETSQDQDNDCDLAKLLLEHGANVNERDRNNATPLDLASYYQKPEIVRVLLDHSAKTNSETAIGKVGVRAAQPLLERDVDVKTKHKDDWTPLHIASYHGKLEVVRLLLDHGATVNAETDNGENPLHKVSCGTYESQEDGVGVAQLLLEHGVDVDVLRTDHSTPLHVASRCGNLAIARLLLDHGANASANAKGDFGSTPLHKVSYGKYRSQDDGIRVAQLLLERGVDVNVSRAADHWTPLHVASCYGNLAIVRLLLDHGAAADAEADNGESPLHKVSHGKYESQDDAVGVAQLLLEHDVDVNVPRTDHSTPLHVASRFGNLAIARLLLDRGANASANAEGDLGSTPLHKVSYGKYNSQDDGVRIARLLLERGVDVNVSRADHWTPLHVASCYGNPAIVRLLLDHGAAADAETDNGENPLHKVSYDKYESQDGAVGVAQLLLEHGVDVNALRTDHSTPLHVASRYGNLAIARLLLDRGANASANAKGDLGSTPLHKVSYGKYKSQDDGVRIAQLLLEHGVDVNVSRADHWTPLHVASCYGNLAIVQLLLDHGAAADAETDNGENPLHKVSYDKYESQDGAVGVAQLLLEHGVDVNALRTDHSTPLHVASRYGNLAIARLLLDRGANASANAEGDLGSTPLHKISYGKYKSQDDGVRVAQLLLERGVDVNVSRTDHWTPLHVASCYGNLAIVRLLLDHGAAADAEADNGENPLHKVSRGKYESQDDAVGVALLLLEHGVDVNVPRTDHSTPLHVASRFGNFAIARLLLDRGAKVDALDDSGKTPLHEVSQGTYDSEDAGVGVARLLLEHGADVNVKAKSGQTPIDYAAHNQRFKLARLLLENAVKFRARDHGQASSNI